MSCAGHGRILVKIVEHIFIVGNNYALNQMMWKLEKQYL